MIEYAVIVQARMGSVRSPGKINYRLLDEPMLAYQIKRLQIGGIDNIIIATTCLLEDNRTEAIAKEAGASCFRGSQNDVLARYLACCQKFEVKNAIRVGGDDPLIDPEGIKVLIDTHKECKSDLVYASHSEGWIYGTAAELITSKSLILACEAAESASDREHVVSFLKQSELFSKTAVTPEISMRRSDIFLSVDYQEDLDLICQIVKSFDLNGDRYGFSQQGLISLYDSGDLEINNRHLHDGF